MKRTKAHRRATGTETMGHEWDGIEELNTPLPRWWLYTFYACIAFAVGYAVVYPSVPLLHEGTHGTFGWTSRGECRRNDAAKAARAPVLAALDATPIEDLPKNPELMAKAVAGGGGLQGELRALPWFGRGGSVGYPNLNDDDWLWGGTLTDIQRR
jgi:cytochrome c oxidase cbb3-type subunit 3